MAATAGVTAEEVDQYRTGALLRERAAPMNRLGF